MGSIKLGGLSRAVLDGRNQGGFSLQKKFVQEYLKGGLFDLAIEIGLVQRVGRDAENQKEEVYKFAHDTFAEYFAARFFTKNEEAVAQKEEWDFFLPKNKPFRDRYRIFEPQWKQTILFWLGRKDIDDEKKTEFIDALITFEDICRIPNQKYKGFYEYRAYFLAAACLTEFPNYPEEKARKIIENITTWSLDNHNPIRWAAHAALKETDRFLAIAFLKELIAKSSNVDILYIRKNAILTLGEIGSDSAIKPLTKILENSNDPCRKNAADALGRTGSHSAIKPLIKVLENPDSDVRGRVARALGEIGSDSAIKPLTKILENINDTCRSDAAKALGKIGSDSAIDPLFKALKDPSEFFVRSEVARALGKIGSDSAINSLIDFLETPDSDSDLDQHLLRSIAAEALGEIGSKSAIHPLIKVLKNPDYGYFLRQSAAKALGEIASKSAIHPLIKVLENPDYEYRVCLSTARTLGKIASESAIKLLIKENFDYDLHKRAWRETDAQAAFSRWHVFEYIFEDRGIGSHSLRKSAAEALGKIGSEAAINPLIELLENPTSDVRQSAVEALGEIGAEAAINPLIELLENPTSDGSLKVSTQPYSSIGKPPQELGNIYDYSMCESIALALGKIGAEAAINPLIELLENHASDSVRQSAARALGKIGSEAAINPLIELLENHASDSVRQSAARALGKIGSDSAINHLIELLNNPASRYSLRNVAAEVLENISAKPHQMVEVISALRDYSHQSKKCYQIIWQYSQNLPYPDFYEAWIKPLWLRRLQQCFPNLFNFKKKKS